MYLIETKGEADQEVGAKARAAVAWCKSASESGVSWEYLFVPEGIFQRFNTNKIELLKGACAGELSRLMEVSESGQAQLPFYQVPAEETKTLRTLFIRDDDFDNLPANFQKMVDEAVNLFNFVKDKQSSFSPCFTPLLSPWDQVSKALVLSLLKSEVPNRKPEQDRYFEPDYFMISERDINWLRKNASSLKKALVYNSFIMPIGLVSFCLEYAKMDPPIILEGIFKSIRNQFGRFRTSKLFDRIEHIRNFRNTYIAHQDENNPLTDLEQAKVELKNWISGLSAMVKVIQKTAAE